MVSRERGGESGDGQGEGQGAGRGAGRGGQGVRSGAPARAAAGRGRGRPRSFDRATALEAALMTFWERGYEATSVSDLTRVMDIGAPSLYRAFGDKRSLFEEVVREYGV
ncbi:helix-turn-helix domain-containing protein, partial [Streptomyces sp. Tu 4128]